MNKPHESFWPDNFGVEPEITPLTILKEQASLLGERTKNLVEGSVQTGVGAELEFRHSLYLVVPTLTNYRYFLLSVHHNPSIYPLEIRDGTSNRMILSHNFDEFRENLKEILSSDRVKRIVSTLLAYAMEPSSA